MNGALRLLRGNIRRRSSRVGPVAMPLISRGLNAVDTGGFGGANAATNAVDADYSTFWRLVNIPSTTPQQWALDISSVSNANKTSALLHWFNDTSLSYWDNVSLQTSANFNNLKRDYTIDCHTAAGGGAPPAIGDVGWTNLVTVTGNVYRSRQHALNLSGKNWVRFRITNANGPAGVNNDVSEQVNIHNVALGNVDNWLFLGDSIMSECMSWRNLDGTPWTNGPLTKLVEVAKSRYPLYQNGGVPTTDSAYGNTNKIALFTGFTGKYAVLGWGANDSSASVTKATYKTNMQAIVTYALGTVGVNLVVLPLVTSRTLNGTLDAFVVQYNAALAEIAATDPTHIKVGPDFYTPTAALTLPLRDGLHPTYAGAGNGYEIMQGLWRDWLVNNIY